MRFLKPVLTVCLLIVAVSSSAQSEDQNYVSLEDLYRYAGESLRYRRGTDFFRGDFALKPPTDPDNLIPEVFEHPYGRSTVFRLDYKSFSPTAAAAMKGLNDERICFDQLADLSLITAETLPEFSELHLNALKRLDPKTAKALANRCSRLQLNGLKELPLAVAKALTSVSESDNSHLHEIHLNGLPDLDKDLAEVLSRFGGWLFLNGVQSLSPEAAAPLVTGNASVEFGSIKKLTPELAQALVPSKGELLKSQYGFNEVVLSGVIEECPEEVERILSKAPTVVLPNLRRVITDELGLTLAQNSFFNRIPRLPTTTARHLSLLTDVWDYQDRLVVLDDPGLAFRLGAGNTDYALGSIQEITPLALHMVLRHQHGDDRTSSWGGQTLNLSGIKNLPVSLTKELGSFYELNLKLDGLKEIPEDLAEVLAEWRGWISLDGVQELSVNAEKAFAKCNFDIQLPALESLKTSELALRLQLTSQRPKQELAVFPAITKLSAEAAQALALGHPAGLSFPALQEISESAAAELVKCEGPVWLSGAKSIPNNTLAKKACRFDCIRTLEELSAQQIKDLLTTSENPWFQLNRVKKIDAAGVKAVMATNPDELLFDGLTELPIEIAELIGSGKQTHISLNGLTKLNAAAFAKLARPDRRLALNGIENVSTDLASQLWKCDRVELLGINRLTPKASRILLEGCARDTAASQSSLGIFASRIPKDLEVTSEAVAGLIKFRRAKDFINRVETLTPSAAAIFSSHKLASFANLKAIDVATATVLIRGYTAAQFKGTLNLESITSITPETAAALAKYPGEIDLSGLATLTNEVATALAHHCGHEYRIKTGLGAGTYVRTATIKLNGAAAAGLTQLTPQVAWLICNAEGTLDLSNVVELTNGAVLKLMQRKTYTRYPGDGTDSTIRFSVKTEFKHPQLVKYLSRGINTYSQIEFRRRANYTNQVARELAKDSRGLFVDDVYYRDRLGGHNDPSLRDLRLTITEPCTPKLAEMIRKCNANVTLQIDKPRFITDALVDAIAERTKETIVQSPVDFEWNRKPFEWGGFAVDAASESTPVLESDIKKLAAFRASLLDVSCKNLLATTAKTLATSAAKVLRINAPEITPDAARALASFAGSRIELNGIQRMEEEAASIFAAWRGQAINVTFIGNGPLDRWMVEGQDEFKLSKQAAENLSRFSGRLTVNDDQINYLEPSTAVALSYLGSDAFQDIQLLHEIMLDKPGCTLAGLCQTIENVTNIPVEVDADALDKSGIPTDVVLEIQDEKGTAIELLTHAFLAAESQAGQGYVLFTYRKSKDDGGALVVATTEPRLKPNGAGSSKREDDNADLPAKGSAAPSDPFGSDPFNFFSPSK